MRIALTGATGIAGHAVAARLLSAGWDIVTLGRRPSRFDVPHVAWSLGDQPDVACDALVHCAFVHAPGRYRGGEGNDPDGFLRLNRDGTFRLLDAVAGAKVVFLSSRAVYGAYPPGTRLDETMPPRPDTLYGRLKAETEIVVSDLGGTSLRATGLYGPAPPGRNHKWADLFADFAAGRFILPRVATELHVDDLADAVELCLRGWTPPVLDVSDILLDRCDLLALYAEISGTDGRLPDRGDATRVSEMTGTRIRALGWMPRGRAGLRPSLIEMLRCKSQGSSHSDPADDG